MYRLAVFLWLLCLGMQQCPAADTDIIVHDDAGKQVTLASPARRVITLAPHLAEMVFAAGAGEFLVGTVEYSDYPPAAQSLPRVGDSFRIDVESILNMRPDVVLVWGSGNPKVLREHLADLQLNVVVLEPRQLEDIAEHLRIIGAITGKRKEAAEAARSYLEDLDELRREYADREKISVFYQISERPLYTINGEHVISALLRMCGGRNIFADLSALAPSVSTESVLQRNPEVIL
ncbi:MAG: cobalamin-binding protein, partial [Gammaproteobacteria bacterium]|nr:cobalamin-binding protein [Gammaproteobacteria bacterium]